MSEAARLFLTLWPDAAVRRELVAWCDGWQWPRGATPVHEDNLHLTLHFIGNVERAAIGALRQALRVPVTPFDVELGVPALWQRGIAVLEPLANPAALLTLHATLAAQLLQAGLALEERPYRPHVTIARCAGGAVPPAAGPQIRWQAAGYALVESTGGRYVVLEHYGAWIRP